MALSEAWSVMLRAVLEPGFSIDAVYDLRYGEPQLLTHHIRLVQHSKWNKASRESASRVPLPGLAI
jgi:hypothetical protein